MALLLTAVAATQACAQAARAPGTVVIGAVGDPSLPIPYLGTMNTLNADVSRPALPPARRAEAGLPHHRRRRARADAGAELAAHRLAHPAVRARPARPLAGRRAGHRPRCGRSPGRSRTNPRINANQAAIETIASVEEAGPRTVRVRFRRAFQEQVYRFAFDFQPLPSHLLEKMAPEAIATSDFAAHPMGDGPYRWSRRVPGQLVELRADTTFFAGRPGIAPHHFPRSCPMHPPA